MTDAPQLPDGPLWFKDAIIYELHIRAFHDSNTDGIGDIVGLIDRLDFRGGSRAGDRAQVRRDPRRGHARG